MSLPLRWDGNMPVVDPKLLDTLSSHSQIGKRQTLVFTDNHWQIGCVLRSVAGVQSILVVRSERRDGFFGSNNRLVGSVVRAWGRNTIPLDKGSPNIVTAVTSAANERRHPGRSDYFSAHLRAWADCNAELETLTVPKVNEWLRQQGNTKMVPQSEREEVLA